MSNYLTSLLATDRPKFVEGKYYWTWYMEVTNKRDALRNVVPVFKTKLNEIRESEYSTGGLFLSFDVPHYLQISGTMKSNLHTYMNGYGIANCQFYETEQEARDGFDERIKELAAGMKAVDRDRAYKKMYSKVKPQGSTLENEAKDWFVGLSTKEKEYLRWFVENRIS